MRHDTLKNFPAAGAAPKESGVHTRGRTIVVRKADFLGEAAAAVRKAVHDSTPAPPPPPVVDALDAFEDVVRTFGEAAPAPDELTRHVEAVLGEGGWWTASYDSRPEAGPLRYHVRWARADARSPSETVAPSFADCMRAILEHERAG